jgi:MYXO-CTERM domain-containing protein
MGMRSWLWVAVAAAAASMATPAAHAAPADPLEASAVDARVRALFRHRNHNGRTLSLFRASSAFESSGRAPLLVRFVGQLSAERRAKYQALGVHFGRALSSGAVKLRADEGMLAAMVADGVVRRVSVDLPPPFVMLPLDQLRGEVDVAAGEATYRRLNAASLTGRGVVFGDMDSSIDPFHPALLKPLAPVPWVDFDGDGVLTPGVDGYDHDNSGTLEPHEVLRHLDGNASNLFGSMERIYGTADRGYNPGWDYLYLDLNGDGRRNVGIEVEGSETLPSMGEPVFAADDVDGGGLIVRPERLIPLGESKVLAINGVSAMYRRGENLASYPVAIGSDDANHATGVMSTAAGGQIGSSRFLGLAPEAEILVANTQDGSSLTTQLQWLVDEGADIVITELSYWGTEPSDGSSEFEQLIDSSVDGGIIVVSPAGNLGFSGKHAFANIPASSASTPYENELVFQDVPSSMFFSVTWREGGVSLAGTLEIPGDDVIDLSLEQAFASTSGGRNYSVTIGTTSKGAGYLIVGISTNNALPNMGTKLTLQSTSTQTAYAALYAIDNASGWSGGMNFLNADVAGCMNTPAFAEKTIALSAYALHVGDEWSPYPEAMGALRGFSGRGPDLWGDPGIDIASPDNPVAAAADGYNNGVADGVETTWREFGGTSGGGGVVAGVAALIKQANPDLTGMALRDAVLATAVSDANVLAGSEDEWGAGKLRLGLDLAPGGPPTVALAIPDNVPPEAEFELTAEVTDDGDVAAAQTRWDFDYDGTWDTDWQLGLTALHTMPAGADFIDVKVEVMDADGWTASALRRVPLGEPLPPIVPASADEEEDGCGCRVVGTKTADTRAWWLLLVAGALVRRRRLRV